MGIHDRDWYQDHYDEKILGVKRRKRRQQAQRPASAGPLPQAQSPARQFRRQRPTTWLDRNWWRLLWCAVFAVLLAALLRAVLRHL